MITPEKIKEALSYDPETGIFTWVGSKRIGWNGKPAGSPHPRGYIHIKINDNSYKAHRLAWFFVYGEWPTNHIDHINGITGDNRIANLREATRSENLANRKLNKNNTSGIKGVHFNARRQRWIGQVVSNGRLFQMCSESKEVIVDWISGIRNQVHGEFANHG